MDKYKIQKDSVQETLIIPLYGRKLAMDMYPENFADNDCQALFNRIDYDFPKQRKVMDKVGAIMGATRQYDLASVCKEYLKKHPKACVVNLGCGLDTTFRQVNNGIAKGYNIDFPDVIAVRNELLPESEREKNIAGDLNDTAWFDFIDYQQENGAAFFAGGVFYLGACKKELKRRLPDKVIQFFECV